MKFNIIESVPANLVGANAETFTAAGFALRQSNSMFERNIPLTGSADFLRTRLSADLPKPELLLEVAHKLVRIKNGKPFEASVIRALDGPRLPEPAWRSHRDQDGSNVSLVGFRQYIRGQAGFYVTDVEVSGTGTGITVFRVKPSVAETKVVCSITEVASASFELGMLDLARLKKYDELVEALELDVPHETRDAYLADIVTALGLAAGNCEQCKQGPHIHPVRPIERLLTARSKMGQKPAPGPASIPAPDEGDSIPMPPPPRRPAPAPLSTTGNPGNKPASARPGKPMDDTTVPADDSELADRIIGRYRLPDSMFTVLAPHKDAVRAHLVERTAELGSFQRVLDDVPEFYNFAKIFGVTTEELVTARNGREVRRYTPRPVPMDLAQFKKDMRWAFGGELSGTEGQLRAMHAWACMETENNQGSDYNNFLEGLKTGVSEKGPLAFLCKFGMSLRNNKRQQEESPANEEPAWQKFAPRSSIENKALEGIAAAAAQLGICRIAETEAPAEEAVAENVVAPATETTVTPEVPEAAEQAAPPETEEDGEETIGGGRASLQLPQWLEPLRHSEDLTASELKLAGKTIKKGNKIPKRSVLLAKGVNEAVADKILSLLLATEMAAKQPLNPVLADVGDPALEQAVKTGDVDIIHMNDDTEPSEADNASAENTGN